MKTVLPFILLFALAAAAQPAPRRRSAPSPDRALAERVWAAWSTLNPDNAAPFYSKDPQNVFYDLVPQKYEGWAAYSKGARELLKTFKALNFTLGNDLRIHSLGDNALGTATWHADITHPNGSHEALDGRWTVIWRRENGRWLIIHEHVSVPLPSETAHPPAPKRQ